MSHFHSHSLARSIFMCIYECVRNVTKYTLKSIKIQTKYLHAESVPGAVFTFVACSSCKW